MPETFGFEPKKDSANTAGRKLTRRQFLKVAGVGLGTLATYEIGKEIFAEKFEDGLYREIKHFENLSEGALVVCANEAEYEGVLAVLRTRNRSYTGARRMRIEVLEARSLSKVEFPVQRYIFNSADPNQPPQPTENYIQVPIYILNASGRSQENAQVLGKHFHLVQLRGHTGDMPGLYEYSQKFQSSEGTLLSLGGCQGVQYIPEWYEHSRLVQADKSTGESANNTYLMLRMVNELASGRCRNWKEFYAHIAEDSTRAQRQSVIPGQADYKDYLKRK